MLSLKQLNGTNYPTTRIFNHTRSTPPTYSKYKVVRINKKVRQQLNICFCFYSMKCGKSDLKPIMEHLRDLSTM